MRALIQTGHKYDQDITGFTNALADVGIQCMVWNESKLSAFATFEECKPDIFIGSTSLMTRAASKCLAQYKPKIALFAEDKPEFEVSPDVVMSYGVIDNDLCSNAIKLCINPCVNMSVITNPEQDASLHCEVLYVGGYNSPLRPQINKFILPLAHDYKLRVFGPGAWPIPHALGNVHYPNVKNIMRNADLYVYLSNSDDDLSWNPFVSMSVGTPVLTNNKKLLNLFNNYGILNFAFELGGTMDISTLISASQVNRKEMLEAGRDIVYNHHTNYHYANYVLKHLGIDKKSELMAALAKRVNNE